MGAWLMARRAREAAYPEDHCWNGAGIGVLGAILGSRIAYVAGHLDFYANPADMFRIWEGGLSLVGGLIGAFGLVWVYTKVKKISFFQLVDLGAPGMGLGIALGRIGDLMIGDHLGKETTGWWGWVYEGGTLISPPPCVTAEGDSVYSTLSGCIEPGIVLHQTALYDMAWSFVILGILLWLARSPQRRGFLFLAWACLYALGRIGTDFLRVDKTWFGLGLTGSQITSLMVLVAGSILLARYKGIPPRASATQLSE